MERAEKIGLGVATGGHVLLFGVLSIGLLTPTPEIFKPKPVEVSLIGETALEAAAPTVSNEAPAPASAPDVAPLPSEEQPPAPVERIVEPRPEPPRPIDRTPPRPAEKPVPVKTVTPKPAQKPAPPKKVAVSKPTPVRPAPAKPAAQAAKPSTKPAVQPPRQSKLGKDFLKGVPAESGGTAQTPTAKKASATVKKSIDVSISAEIKPFWQKNAPSGVDVEQLVTVVELRLAQDGSLAATPRCLPTTGVTDSNRNQAGLHCERAIKAARLAAPFKLPAEYYDDWKTWRVTFRTR